MSPGTSGHLANLFEKDLRSRLLFPELLDVLTVSDALPYDAFLLVSFGGPEGPDDVIPFLENVLRGKNVPRERMMEVAEHYMHFGGVSPINEQNRALLGEIEKAFKEAAINLPIYWGNRNWAPTIPEALEEMGKAGHKRVLAFFTSMFSCYSGCRQYRENIINAQEEVGSVAPVVQKLRFGFNHPRFIAAVVARVRAAVDKLQLPDSQLPRLLFTAHSIPNSMADNCDYEKQLREACSLVAEQIGHESWQLVYQSRSGPPQQPWLEPDIVDTIQSDYSGGAAAPPLVIIPIGFISDHMEVLFDLDEEAATACRDLGVQMQRAETVGTHPEFVKMIVELVQERMDPSRPREAIGALGPWHDICPTNCCLYPRPTRPAAATQA